MGWLQFVYRKALWDSSRIHNNAMRNGAGAGACAASGNDFMIFLLFVCLCSWLGWVSVPQPPPSPQPRLSRTKWSFHFLLDSSALRLERWAPWPFALHVKFTVRLLTGKASIIMHFLSDLHLREITQTSGYPSDFCTPTSSAAPSRQPTWPNHHVPPFTPHPNPPFPLVLRDLTPELT